MDTQVDLSKLKYYCEVYLVIQLKKWNSLYTEEDIYCV